MIKSKLQDVEIQNKGNVLYLKAVAVALGLIISLMAGFASAEIALTYDPIKAFEPYMAHYPTGVSWGDMNNDGWLDMVLANGIDVTFSANEIYYNYDGKLEDIPGWISNDARPTGNLYLGDLNNDGWLDLAVSNLGQTPQFSKEYQGYYYNTGSGMTDIISVSPTANSFSCAMGDPDGDGDLDIAYAMGNAVSNAYQSSKIYFNEGGVIDSIPDWQTDELFFGVDIVFVDIDLDGDLDLALGGRNMGVAIFYNNDGVIETAPSWHTYEIVGGRQIAFADVDGDGYPDLAAAGIAQGFFLFKNYAGTLEMTPSWSSPTYGEPSAVAFADVDGDGDYDLAGGGWNSHLGVFENIDGVLTDTYAWKYGGDGSDDTYNLQQIAWADFDEDGVIDTSQSFTGNGIRKLFYLAHKPIHELYSLEIDGTPLELSEYCYDPAEGWISLAAAPVSGGNLTIEYSYSNDLDLTANTTARVLMFENLKEYDRPLEGTNILFLMGMEYGANINIEDGSINILDNFARYGWNTTITGITSSIAPCAYNIGVGAHSIDVDILVSDITDISSYDALVLGPCNSSYEAEMVDPDVLNLINDAVDAGLVVAAWCPATRLLAAADVINGKTVTGKADYSDEYEAAGATYAGIVEPVIDGNIVTIVRSNFYRSEGCQAIYDALYLKSYPVFEIETAYFSDDNSDGFYDPGESAEFFVTFKNLGISANDVSITLTCNDPEVTFITPTITFPFVEGGGTTIDNYTLPIEYIVPDPETPRYDSFFVTFESEFGVFDETFGYMQEVGHTEVLIIDDDRGASYEEIYFNDFFGLGVPCHIWDKSAKSLMDYPDLGDYHMVFWYTGDSAEDYLLAEDIAAMKSYLDNGGNLFLSGQGLASELHQEDSAFMADYLHCYYNGISTFSTTRLGNSGSPIGDGIDVKLGGGSTQSESLAQAITPINGGIANFGYYYSPGDKCAVSYSGAFKTLFFTFGYESISSNYTTYAGRDTVLSRIISFFPEFMCGDADNSESVNILDVSYLISYLYKGGAMPASLWASDADGNGSVNILDVSYIVNYLYKGGNPPLCP